MSGVPLNEYGSKQFRDALALYKVMDAKAENVKPIDLIDVRFPQDKPNMKLRVFRGTIKALAEANGFSAPKAHGIMGYLYRVESVTVLARPTPFLPGVWILNFEPTIEQLKAMHESVKGTDRAIRPGKVDAMLFEITQLKGRVSKLEGLVKDINDNLRGSASLS
jgi:hypothetical protein